MKTIPILLSVLLVLPAVAAGPGKGRKANHRKPPRGGSEQVAERAAMREEARLDHLDTHKWKKDPAATDKRPDNLGEYHKRTYQRIVRLLHHGAITEADGLVFKQAHTEITEEGKELRADGEMTSEEKQQLRDSLDRLNDEINQSLKDSEEGSARTPHLNHVQHRFQERIEFGIRSGRLSNAEASRLTRKVEKLADIEARAKEGGLSTREREKLFEEAIEIQRELRKELMD